MHQVEEEKLPESSQKSQKSEAKKTSTIVPKKINFADTPAKKNPQSQFPSPSHNVTPGSPREYIVPHARNGSSAVSEVSEIEAHVLQKMR